MPEPVPYLAAGCEESDCEAGAAVGAGGVVRRSIFSFMVPSVAIFRRVGAGVAGRWAGAFEATVWALCRTRPFCRPVGVAAPGPIPGGRPSDMTTARLTFRSLP